MREVMAVTGFVPAGTIVDKDRLSKGSGMVELRPERTIDQVLIRVSGSDVEDVRVGATHEGMMLVQLILRNGAPVETVVKSTATPPGMRVFHDPVLNRVTQEATAKSITV